MHQLTLPHMEGWTKDSLVVLGWIPKPSPPSPSLSFGIQNADTSNLEGYWFMEHSVPGLKIKALLSFKGLALCESEAVEHYCPSKVGEGRGYNPLNS